MWLVVRVLLFLVKRTAGDVDWELRKCQGGAESGHIGTLLWHRRPSLPRSYTDIKSHGSRYADHQTYAHFSKSNLRSGRIMILMNQLADTDGSP